MDGNRSSSTAIFCLGRSFRHPKLLTAAWEPRRWAFRGWAPVARGGPRRWWRYGAALCLLGVLSLAGLDALHAHPFLSAAHARTAPPCLICQLAAAQHAGPPRVSAPPPQRLREGVTFRWNPSPPRAGAILRLDIRPPPHRLFGAVPSVVRHTKWRLISGERVRLFLGKSRIRGIGIMPAICDALHQRKRGGQACRFRGRGDGETVPFFELSV